VVMMEGRAMMVIKGVRWRIRVLYSRSFIFFLILFHLALWPVFRSW